MLTNIRSLDKTTPIVLLFLESDFTVPIYFEGRYNNLEIHSFVDARTERRYLPSIRPYLCYHYFKQFPQAQEDDYFQIDSDIIFRELPDWSKMSLNGRVCWASDCSGYIDYKYLSSRKNWDKVIKTFVDTLGVSEELIKNTPGGGAQWLISKPTAQLWEAIWKGSDALYLALQDLETDLQKWTAEMWAELYCLASMGWEVKLSSELDFCRPTDDISLWDRVKILHNAGVLVNDSYRMFFKGNYLDKTPFKAKLDFVDPSKASIKYVEAIKKVLQ